LGQGQQGNYNCLPLLTPRLRDFVKLKQVDGVVHDLITIGALHPCALELDHEQHPIGEQEAVHPQATAPEVELQNDVPHSLAARFRQGLSDDADTLADVLLKQADATAPLLALFGLDVEALAQRAACELVGDCKLRRT